MLKQIKRCKATFILITTWSLLYLTGKKIDLLYYFAGKGIQNIGNEYYRFFTGPLLHFNLLHLIVNISAIFWVGYFLEKGIGSIKFIMFGLAIGTFAEFLYASIFRTSENNIGGSVYIFAYIGLIIALQIYKKDFAKFQIGTSYGNWILSYAILGNVPFLPLITFGTISIHFIAVFLGSVIGAIFIKFRIL